MTKKKICVAVRKTLSRFFGKNFVKATHLLNNSLKSWFDGKISVRVNFSYLHSVEKSKIIPTEKYFIKPTNHIASISFLAKPLFSRNFAKKAWRQISAFSTMRSSTYSHNYIIIKLINVVLVDSTSTWDEYFRKVHLCEIVDLVSCYLSTYLILHNNVIRSIVHL